MLCNVLRLAFSTLDNTTGISTSCILWVLNCSLGEHLDQFGSCYEKCYYKYLCTVFPVSIRFQFSGKNAHEYNYCIAWYLHVQLFNKLPNFSGVKSYDFIVPPIMYGQLNFTYIGQYLVLTQFLFSFIHCNRNIVITHRSLNIQISSS